MKRQTMQKTSETPPKKGGKNWFDKTVAWIHLWPSLVSAVILIFVCLTGTIIVYCDEIVSLSAGNAKYVQQVLPEKIPVENIIANLKKEFPKRHTPGYMVTYKDPQRSVRFNMYDKDAGLRMVYVDPYTGKILKDDGTIYFFYITAHLHNSFLAGKVGQWVVDIATIIFLIELITGIILWWPKKWTKATRDASFKIKWKAKFKRVNYDLHNVLGFYSLALAMLLTVTGLIIAFKPLAEWTIKRFGGTPNHEWENQQRVFEPEEPISDMNAVIASLFAMYPDKREAQVYTYQLDSAGHYGMRLAKSVGLKSAEGALNFMIDRYSGKQIPLPDDVRIHEVVENTYWNLHMGKWMGPLGKFLTFTAGLIATSLPITGFYIWWGRRKKGKKVKSNRPHTAAAETGTPSLKRSTYSPKATIPTNKI